MGTKMYRNITGWHEEDEKHDATHMLLTLEEYNSLCNQRDRAISAKNKAERDAQDFKRRAEQEANASVREARNAAAAQIAQMQSRVDAAEAETERQSNLNRNLLRITRERANAKRGLQPKKTHSGYRFSDKIRQTKTISGHDKKTGAIYTDVWTATLETPYDGTIPINQIRDRIFADMMGQEGILKKLYVEYFTYQNNDSVIWKGTYTQALEGADANKNYLFDYKFMVNPKTRLWEVQITTTKSIRALAEMMDSHPPKRSKSQPKRKVGGAETMYADDSDLDHTWIPDPADLFGDGWDED